MSNVIFLTFVEAEATGGDDNYSVIYQYYANTGNSSMQKNTAGKWTVLAIQGPGGTTPGARVTGDAANITANIRIDGGAANAVDDVNPTELEDGLYVFDITAAEANGDQLTLSPASSTANVEVIAQPFAQYTTPPNFNDAAITATGAVGINWANVENPSTSVDLSATAINLCDTVTTNTDMKGTDNALLAASAPSNFSDMAITVTTGLVSVGTNNDKSGYSISGTITTLDGLNDIAATDIVTGGAITTVGGAVSNVTLVGTTTTNTDMRGTDGALLAVSYTAPDNASIALVLADANELQTNQGNWVTATGFATSAQAAAIQAKTDQMAFTVANQIDSNIQSINDVVITGDGQVGTEFGVA